jgi:hypothetical protein
VRTFFALLVAASDSDGFLVIVAAFGREFFLAGGMFFAADDLVVIVAAFGIEAFLALEAFPDDLVVTLDVVPVVCTVTAELPVDYSVLTSTTKPMSSYRSFFPPWATLLSL